MSTVTGIALLTHIVAAMAWFGGALFVVTRFGPAMRDAGTAAGPVRTALLLRGGMTPFFLPASILTIASGLYLYGAGRWWEVAGTDGLLMNAGILTGVVALMLGALVSTPTEKAMKRLLTQMDDPTPEQAEQMLSLSLKGSRMAKVILILVSISVFGMAGRGIF